MKREIELMVHMEQQVTKRVYQYIHPFMHELTRRIESHEMTKSVEQEDE